MVELMNGNYQTCIGKKIGSDNPTTVIGILKVISDGDKWCANDGRFKASKKEGQAETKNRESVNPYLRY